MAQEHFGALERMARMQANSRCSSGGGRSARHHIRPLGAPRRASEIPEVSSAREASEPAPVGASSLLDEARQAISIAAETEEAIRRQRIERGRSREELAASVTEHVLNEVLRLRQERTGLETKLAKQIRRLHGLEVSSMLVEEQRWSARAHAKKLKQVLDHAQGDSRPGSQGRAHGSRGHAATGTGSQIKMQLSIDGDCHAINGMDVQFMSHGRVLNGNLDEAYREKHYLEMETVRHRHVAAITEGLYRARTERGRQPGPQYASIEADVGDIPRDYMACKAGS